MRLAARTGMVLRRLAAPLPCEPGLPSESGYKQTQPLFSPRDGKNPQFPARHFRAGIPQADFAPERLMTLDTGLAVVLGVAVGALAGIVGGALAAWRQS